jgi:long-chain fatty acid transport protein
MRGITTTVRLLTVLAVVVWAAAAQAGGLYISTFGTPETGTASAGANAIADDASTALHNAAGMTRLDDHALQGNLAPGFNITEFDADADTPSGGRDGGNQGGFIPILSSQYVHRISERWRFGLSLFSFSGAVLDPDDDWAGRNQTTKVSLFTLSLMPSLAVQATDWLSLGLGVAVTYGKLDLYLRAPILSEPAIELDDMSDWAAAPFASVLLEPTPELRIGVLYQGETDFHLDGDVNLPIGVTPGIDLNLPLAQAVRTSVYWETTPRIALLASAGWEDWSAAENLPVSIARGSAAVPLEFRDTWYLAGGIHYRLTDDLTLQTGLRYDSSALRDGDRTAALPVDRIYTLGVGGLYDWSESVRLGLSFAWASLGEAPLDNAFVKGKYGMNDMFLFGLSLYWKKLPWSGRATL